MGVGAGETGQAREIEQKSLQQLNVKLGNQVRYLHGAEAIFNSKFTITSDKLLSHVYLTGKDHMLTISYITNCIPCDLIPSFLVSNKVKRKCSFQG